MHIELRRLTSQGKIIEEIDGLRLVAIAMVFVAHLEGIWLKNSSVTYHYTTFDTLLHRFIVIGPWGVQLFFIISGFILAMPWMKAMKENKPAPGLKDFYLRRVTRLEPPYILSCIFFFVALVALGKFTWDELLPHLMATLLYVHNFIYGYGSLINRAAWSLEIEIQYYLLAPFLIVLLIKALTNHKLIVLALTCLYPFLFIFIGFSHTGLHHFIHYFITGAILAYFYAFDKINPAVKSYGYDVLALVVVLTAYFLANQSVYTIALIGMPVLLGVFFLCAFKSRILNYFLTRNYSVIIGGMCYSIYLLHGRLISFPIEIFLKKYIHTGHFALDMLILFLVIAPFTVLMSGVFYILIERPCMDKRWPGQLVAFLKIRPRAVEK